MRSEKCYQIFPRETVYNAVEVLPALSMVAAVQNELRQEFAIAANGRNAGCTCSIRARYRVSGMGRKPQGTHVETWGINFAGAARLLSCPGSAPAACG